MQYDKVYLQKMKASSPVKETVADFDIYCASMPFKLYSDAKDLSKRDWYDEHGEDEYIPEEGLKLKSYTIDVTFCCKGDKNSSNIKIKKFLDYLTGNDGSGVELKMYCTWTKIGRKSVRFTKLNDDARLVRDDDGDVLVFKVSFKVNDPITDISPIVNGMNVITDLR
jgi:hypothetical protein|nr:MAG TPA: hypothetical protein [Caudoviricetes sp.]